MRQGAVKRRRAKMAACRSHAIEVGRMTRAVLDAVCKVPSITAVYIEVDHTIA
jgi:hypothetical protein